MKNGERGGGIGKPMRAESGCGAKWAERREVVAGAMDGSREVGRGQERLRTSTRNAVCSLTITAVALILWYTRIAVSID